MFKKVRPYMGSYIRYTYAALGAMFAGLIASAVPFFMVYRIIRLLLSGEKPSAGFIIIHLVGVFGLGVVDLTILHGDGFGAFHFLLCSTLDTITLHID